MMKVGILMGGVSPERGVSLKSGHAMAEGIDHKKYDAVEIILDREEDAIEKTRGIDFALLALHGRFGEDGIVQSVMETMGIPYSGCGPLCSAMCMDKDVTKSVLKAAGVRTAPWVNVRKSDLDGKVGASGLPSLLSLPEEVLKKVRKIGYPVVVKPTHGGSSFATFIVNSEEELMGRVGEAFSQDKEVMIEKFIKGRELTCPVMAGETLPVLEIKPRNEFFDFEAKYEDGGAEEIVAKLPAAIAETVHEMTLATYRALKCEVYARVDMIVTETGEPYVLEVNTLPGMTQTSLIPKSAAAAGIDFKTLVDRIIEESLKVRG